MKRILAATTLLILSLAACSPVDLNAPLPVFDPGVDPDSWAQVLAGEFYSGQFDEVASTGDYQIMITDVTAAQYAEFLNEALSAGDIKIDGDRITGFYPGDEFRGVKHEERIDAGEWIFIPLNDPAQRI